MAKGEKPRQASKSHWSDPTSTREYWVSGATTRTDAETELDLGNYVPLVDTINGISRFYDSWSFKEGVGGGGNWDVVVSYSKSPNLKQHTIEIGVSNTKMMEALELIKSYDCSDPPVDPDAPQPGIPDFGGAINVHDNNVNGVDVEIGAFTFSVDKIFQFSLLDQFYIKTLRDMSPSVNDAEYTIKWNGQIIACPSGSLKFRGCSMKQIATDGLSITFKFAYSKNITADDGIFIGNSYAIEKRGWDYLWPYYESLINPTTNRRVQRPRSAYVVRVYNYADFEQLGLNE